jgi:hypothetical protein
MDSSTFDVSPGIGILHDRGNRCVYSATDEVLDSLSTKPRIKYTVSSLFSPCFGFSFSPLFCPFSSALGSNFMAYKCNLHSYRIALTSEKILDIPYNLALPANIQGVSKEGSDNLEEEK